MSEDALRDWMQRIRDAAARSMTPEYVVERQVRDGLFAAYQRSVEKGGILVRHGDVPRFTLERVKPKLRAELDRRILASTALIKLNREQAVEKTLQRLSGWATSIPVGGSDVVDKNPVKTEIRKALAQLPFEVRRVAIDQSHKLVSSVSNIIATDGGALAVRWNSHFRDAHYHFRPDHKIRDGKVYAIRGNWAIEAGYMKAGPAGYYDQVTAFAEEPFCRCYGSYLYALRRLPPETLTEKGREWLAERAKVAA